jgi:tetratricopeptide (TPR) repeat protein
VKKLAICFIIVCFGVTAFSQDTTAVEYYQLLNETVDPENSSKVIHYGIKAFELMDDPQLAEKKAVSAMVVGDEYDALGDENSARNYYRKAFLLAKSDLSISRNLYYNAWSYYAESLAAVDSLEKAVEMYESLLGEIDQKFGDTSQFYGVMNYNYGNTLWLYTNRKIEAGNRIEKAVYLAREHGAAGEDMAKLTRTLGEIKHDLGAYRKADYWYIESLSYLMKMEELDYPFMGKLSRLIGWNYYQLGVIDSADLFLSRAIELIEYVNTDHQYDVLLAGALSNKAWVLVDQGKETEFAEIISRAKALYQKTENEVHYLLWAAEAWVFVDKDPVKAEQLYQQAVRQLEKSEDEEPENVLKFYCRVVVFYLNEGRAREAKTYLDKASVVLEDKAYLEACAYYYYAAKARLLSVNRFDQSTYKIYLQATEKLTSCAGKNHSELIFLYRKLGRNALILLQYEKAVTHYEEALRLVKLHHGLTDESTYYTLCDLALLYKHQKEKAKLKKVNEHIKNLDAEFPQFSKQYTILYPKK